MSDLVTSYSKTQYVILTKEGFYKGGLFVRTNYTKDLKDAEKWSDYDVCNWFARKYLSGAVVIPVKTMTEAFGIEQALEILE